MQSIHALHPHRLHLFKDNAHCMHSVKQIRNIRMEFINCSGRSCIILPYCVYLIKDNEHCKHSMRNVRTDFTDCVDSARMLHSCNNHLQYVTKNNAHSTHSDEKRLYRAYHVVLACSTHAFVYRNKGQTVHTLC